MPLAHLCLKHAQESSAVTASKGLDTNIQSSHLEMPVSAGLALNPPSHGQMQTQNGDASGVHCVPAFIAVATLHAAERIRPSPLPSADGVFEALDGSTLRCSGLRWQLCHNSRLLTCSSCALLYAAGPHHPAGRNQDLNFCVDQLFPDGDFDHHGLGDEGLPDVDLLHDLNFELDGTDPAPV